MQNSQDYVAVSEMNFHECILIDLCIIFNQVKSINVLLLTEEKTLFIHTQKQRNVNKHTVSNREPQRNDRSVPLAEVTRYNQYNQ